ncbi:hypothetical protein TNCV_4001681 [Trichonephila clavipes]|uniref:Uncharacterized protein n=1 Tax=Trichonephila clavipes TaxID=2585209 RepID=A0A8X6V9X4_TRICX|nr:hypothetical protein TNCV_4001681 [Trichonephila clavipes]
MVYKYDVLAVVWLILHANSHKCEEGCFTQVLFSSAAQTYETDQKPKGMLQILVIERESLYQVLIVYTQFRSENFGCKQKKLEIN